MEESALFYFFSVILLIKIIDMFCSTIIHCNEYCRILRSITEIC